MSGTASDQKNSAPKQKIRIMNNASRRIRRMARAYPVSDAYRHPPVVTINGQGVPQRPRLRPEKQVEKHIKIASWKVGSMTGRGREIVEVLKRRTVRIACVQETKWARNSTRELGRVTRFSAVEKEVSRMGLKSF